MHAFPQAQQQARDGSLKHRQARLKAREYSPSRLSQVVPVSVRFTGATATEKAASTQWRNVADQLIPKTPKLATTKVDAERDELDYVTFPHEHHMMLHCTSRSGGSVGKSNATAMSRGHLPRRRCRHKAVRRSPALTKRRGDGSARTKHHS